MALPWTAPFAALIALQIATATQLAFDVASIKESNRSGDGGTFRFMPDGGVAAQHIPARTLITIAHGLEPFQLIGAPDWIRQRRYDVNAKPAERATREQSRAMLQALLTDRFKLAVHRENRQLDGYALVRSGTALGPDLRPSTIDCGTSYASVPQCRRGEITDASMRAFGVPIWSVLELVISQLGVPVSDDTALAGFFDVSLRWSNDIAGPAGLPSIGTALQEQLGLKLERRRVTTEVVVVDHVERPSPD